ncbi:MAG: iron export ABC transporter permease subunit FetB [Magnetococcales bacterium]|nr:iron export ABC transporter permease subunit FetB [Magnetococcales bacterium]
MSIIQLTPLDIGLAALLVFLLALLSWHWQLGVGKSLLIAAVRTVVQLSLIGMVLKTLFDQTALLWVAVMASVMWLVAGREVIARQKRRFAGPWSYGIGASAMFLSSFVITLFSLLVVISPDPWFTPQYAIPLLGMMLGNTLNSIALSLDRFTHEIWRERSVVEGRLLMGMTWKKAVRPYQKQALRSGMIPTINAMAAAGLVSLPGMMTGQILGGNPPVVAVMYQIMIMFMIASGAGFGAMLAIWLSGKRLSDHRQRLRLDRLT